MARRGLRSGPYNGAAKVQGAPAAKNGGCAAMELVWVTMGLWATVFSVVVGEIKKGILASI